MNTNVPTYQKTITIEKPVLEIWHDEDCFYNPIEDYGGGVSFAGAQKEAYGDNGEGLSSILFDTAEEATSQDDHKNNAIKEAQEQYKDAYIYPVYKYEHSRIAYSTTPFSCPWDSCFYGLMLIDKKEANSEEEANSFASSLLEQYSSAMNGELYGFTLYDSEGEAIDSCGGFYDLESIKDYLPAELKEIDLYSLLS